jgi:hypothetical protein
VADLNGQTLAVIARTTTAQVRNFKASGWSGKIHNHPQE